MSGNDLDQSAAGGIGLAFLLSEFRDLRKGMESRDETLRSSIDGVRESVNVLGAKVDRSQSDVDAMRGQLETVQTDMHSLRDDVDSMQSEREAERIKKESSWLGPWKIGKTIIFLGAVATAMLALWKFSPAIIAFFSAVPPAG